MIKRKRKNTNKHIGLNLYKNLAAAIVEGSPYSLVNAMIYCSCEFCENCRFNRCLCDIDYKKYQQWTKQKVLELVTKLPDKWQKEFYR